MAENNPQRRALGVVKAELATFGSWMLSMVPESWNLIGRADVPSYIPLYWHHLRNADLSRTCPWVTYNGVPGSGRTPRNYGAAAIILVDREQMDSLHRSHPMGEQAVAYKDGTEVMVGTSSKNKILGLERADAEDYQFAMRIGEGPLEAQVGIEMPGQIFLSRSRTFEPLDHGVRRSFIVPISELPPSVPLV